MGQIVELGSAIQRLMPIDGGDVPSALEPPTLAMIFDSLERVDPFNANTIIMRDDVWERVGPEYERLARGVDPRCTANEKRAAWKLWRVRLRSLRRQFENEERAAR